MKRQDTRCLLVNITEVSDLRRSFLYFCFPLEKLNPLRNDSVQNRTWTEEKAEWLQRWVKRTLTTWLHVAAKTREETERNKAASAILTNDGDVESIAAKAELNDTEKRKCRVEEMDKQRRVGTYLTETGSHEERWPVILKRGRYVSA